ncbi:MAG: hypothetical protein ACYDC8_09795 [Gammaproteobacteria bacterium]
MVIIITGHDNLFLLYRLANHGVITIGHVIELRAHEHTTVIYLFTSDGKSYTGKGYSGYGNPPFNLLKIGDPVQITYLPNTPQLSCSGDAKEQLREQVLMMASLPIIVFVVSFFLFQRKTS